MSGKMSNYSGGEGGIDGCPPGSLLASFFGSSQKGHHGLFVEPNPHLRFGRVRNISTPSTNKKTNPMGWLFYLAERVGFEPTRRYERLHAFQACAIDHSATSPTGTLC